MSEASQTLQRIVRGAGIVFVGIVISMFFGFLIRVTIARYFSIEGYGVLNFVLIVLSITLVLNNSRFFTIPF